MVRAERVTRRVFGVIGHPPASLKSASRATRPAIRLCSCQTSRRGAFWHRLLQLLVEPTQEAAHVRRIDLVVLVDHGEQLTALQAERADEQGGDRKSVV